MADRIKGITVEINGDTSKLSDALRGVDKNLKETQKQLKDVNSALKLDPKNVELLRQKQRLLNDAVADSSKKLDILKKAQADAAKEMEGGSEEARKNYDKLTIEIAKAEANMKKLQDQARQTNDQLNEADKGKLSNLKENLDKAADAAGKAGDKIAGIGEKASVASGLVLALGAAALTAFQEVDEGADTIIKKTGATGEAAAELQSVYEEVASNVKTTFEDAGAAVGEINTRWGATGDELRDLATEFIKFADINDQDVNGAIVGVDKAMKTFNVDSSKTTAVMGLLTKTAQNTGISVGTLEGLLQTNGAALMEMGLGLGESVQLMGALERSGADVSSVMAGLKKAATEYSKSGEDMSSGLQDLISRLQDSSTTAEATEEAYTIFGSRAGLAFVSLAKQGKINLGNLEGDFKGYETVVSSTYEATQDGTDKLAITANRTKIALGKLGATLSDALAPILDDINDVIGDTTEWLGSLSQEEKTQILRVGGIIAAAGPLTTIVGKLISGVATLVKGIAAISNPLTITLGAIGALGIVVGNAADEMERAQLAAYGWDEDMIALGKDIDESSTKMGGLISSLAESSAGIGENRDRVTFLWDELNKIVGKNSEIKDGYTEQARILADEINKELGTQLELVGNTLSGYNEVAGAIDKIIEKKTIEALLDAGRDEWLAAKQDEARISNELRDVTVERSKAQEELTRAQEDYTKAVEEHERKVAEYGGDSMMFQIELGEIEDNLNTAREAFNRIDGNYQKAVATYGKNQSVLKGYNSLLTASYSNDAKTMKTASDDYMKIMQSTDEQFATTGQNIVNDVTAALLGARDATDRNAAGVQRSVERLLNPVNKAVDETIAKMVELGRVTSGQYSSNITVTNNNTLTLDGNVVAQSVNKSLGRTIGRYGR